MKELIRTTGEINRNFKIKVNGKAADGKKLNTLVGVSGAIDLIGVELFNRLIKRAFESTTNCCVCKLRRGLKFSFYTY